MPIPLALGLSPGSEAPDSREQGTAVQAEPVHLSFCSWCSPAFLAAERGAADRFHPAGSLAQGHQSPHFPPADKSRGEGEVKSGLHPFNFSFLILQGTSWLFLTALSPNRAGARGWWETLSEPCTSGPPEQSPQGASRACGRGVPGESGPPATASVSLPLPPEPCSGFPPWPGPPTPGL